MDSAFWLEYQISGAGEYFFGTFKDCMQRAFDMCISPSTEVLVFDGQNKKIAIQTLRGAKWVAESYRN
jgi:hypothetical protein